MNWTDIPRSNASENSRTGSAPALSVSPYFFRKRIVDTLGAALLLVPGLPLILFLAILTKLTSKGPAIFSQVRVGKDGRVFTMYKIRTMVQDAEALSGAVWATKTDPRVTFLGRILRKLHLDELPQLLNVLRGEMTLVGPRPERPEFVDLLEAKVPGYMLRLRVPPGVTGLAQLNLPADRNLDDVRRKLTLDLEYIENASLSFDLRLILGTVCRFVNYFHKTPLRFLGIYREPEESPWADFFGVPREISAQTGSSRSGLFSPGPKPTGLACSKT